MPLLIHLKDLTDDNALELSGELPPAELDLGGIDPLMTAPKPLKYDLTVTMMGEALLVQGEWSIPLAFECARCLKRFEQEIADPQWACHLPLEGEEAVPISDETVDLTSAVREDIVLALPQHPGCGEGCAGMPEAFAADSKTSEPGGGLAATDWSDLDKLKL